MGRVVLPSHQQLHFQLWHFVTEFSAHYRTGHRCLKEREAHQTAHHPISEKLEALKQRASQVEKRMNADSVRMMPNEVLFQHPTGLPTDDGVMMEGYLFKRATNAFKSWNRRWFMIKEDKLVSVVGVGGWLEGYQPVSVKLYSHKTLDGAAPTVMEDNLKLCLVRPAPPTVSDYDFMVERG